MSNNFYVQVSPSHRYGPFAKREANALIKKMKGKLFEWQDFGMWETFPNIRYPFLVERTEHGRDKENTDKSE